MADERVHRRLAAVLAADVVGYSRLMERDEAGTLAALKARRSGVLQPAVSKHRGRIVKFMGDGVLVEFASAVDAVECAVQLQEAMEAANPDVPPERRIVLRVGINLGDVIVEGSDLYGDGVNIAARLESLARPGAIVVSQTVFNHVRGKVRVGFKDLGEHRLRNIAEPVKVYEVSGANTDTVPRPRTNQPTKPSIAVLPFTNMSGDQEQEYFSDGITEDIITDLSQVSALFVVARNTAFTFKGRAVEIVQAARQLNVGYILEGSVRKAGSRLRITVQLIDGSTGGHLWAERFDRDFGDIFALQDEISKCVVGALKIKLLPNELKAITTRSTTNTEAYECYLQGRALLQTTWSATAILGSARKMFERAVELDTEYAKAYAGIADCDAFAWISGKLDISYERMLAISSRAIDLMPNLAEAHASKGVALYLGGHAGEAIAAFEQAIALDPELWESHLFYGFSCRDTGRFEQAAPLFERAAALHPGDWISTGMLSDVYESLGQRELSVAAARQTIVRVEAALLQRPDNAEALGMGAANLVFLGENAKAEEWARRAILLDPDSFGIRYNVACVHAVAGKPDAALEDLEEIYSRMPRVRPWLLGMLNHDTQVNSLRSRPDFQAFLSRLEAAVGS